MHTDDQTPNTNTKIYEISADQVSDFLRSHPHFFEKHASLLTEIYLPSPHGNGAISLAERQQLAQRDKIRVLEVKLADLITFAEENDATSAKVHDLSLKLIASNTFSGLQQLIHESMQQDFAVTQSILRIWLKPHDSLLAQEPAFTAVDETFSDWAMALSTPFCGAKPAFADKLVADNLQSFAFIPLFKKSDKPVLGVLILGSDEPHRFKANMGTMYLKRIGELVSTALATYL
ncbi:MAG: DUF484 family protein [Methylotenera sp.]